MPAKLLVFQSLVGLDERGELEPRLARSWEHTDDYRHWTIHLRPDVRWHDGTPFTAWDVAFTYELLSHPDVLWLPRGAVSTSVLDDSTLTVDVAADRVFDPLDPWEVVFPKHLLEGLEPANFKSWDFWAMPVGTGAYRYSRHVPNTMTEFVAYPEYWRGEAAIDTISVKYAESSPTEVLAGNVDVLGWARIEDLPAFERAPDFAIYFDEGMGSYRAVVWNWRVPALRDARVRRGLTFAIDRRALNAVQGWPEDAPIMDVLPRDRSYRRGELPPPLQHDPDAAQTLLEEAGWVDRDGDGVRERDGRPLRFEILVSSEEEKAAVFVQRELAEVGVEVEVLMLQLNVVRRRLASGDFDAAIRMFGVSPGGRYGSAAVYGTNSLLGYENAEVAALLERARSAINPDTIDAIYRALWPHFQRDLPMTYLGPGMQAFVAHRRIRGLESGFRAAPLMNMEYLRVDDEP